MFFCSEQANKQAGRRAFSGPMTMVNDSSIRWQKFLPNHRDRSLMISCFRIVVTSSVQGGERENVLSCSGSGEKKQSMRWEWVQDIIICLFLFMKKGVGSFSGKGHILIELWL
jgi:hypothetical protein